MMWPVYPLGEVASIQGGIQKQPRRAPKLNPHPFLRVANVTAKGLDLADVHSIELFGGELERYRLESGDLLVVEGNGSAHQIGRAAVWDGSISNAVHQNHLIRVRPDSSMDSKFLGLVWNAPSIRQELTDVASSSSGLHTLSVAKLRRIEIPVPGLDEQRRIVDLLEEHLSRLDAADKSLDLSLAKLGGLRNQTILRALTAADVSDRAEPTLADVGTADDKLPSLPVGWSWSRLGDVAEVIGGITKDSSKQDDPSFVEVPYLRVANVQRGHLNLDTVSRIRVSPSKAEVLRLERGDVLLNEGGDRDKLARGWVWEGQIDRCIHQNHVFRARVHEPRLNPYFLSWTANTIGGRWAEQNGKQSVNLASISLRMIKQMPVIVPAPGDAERVVTSLHDALESLESLASSLRSARRHGTALHRSLLAAAFSGRLTGSASNLSVAEQMIDQ